MNALEAAVQFLLQCLAQSHSDPSVQKQAVAHSENVAAASPSVAAALTGLATLETNPKLVADAVNTALASGSAPKLQQTLKSI